VESLTGLHGIELSGNPWACDCRLRALKEWLLAANVPQTIEPTWCPFHKLSISV
jgi:netrin-G1 ligand